MVGLLIDWLLKLVRWLVVIDIIDDRALELYINGLDYQPANDKEGKTKRLLGRIKPRKGIIISSDLDFEF